MRASSFWVAHGSRPEQAENLPRGFRDNRDQRNGQERQFTPMPAVSLLLVAHLGRDGRSTHPRLVVQIDSSHSFL